MSTDPKNSHETPEARHELVAYLDGELRGEDLHQVEELLSRDALAREELRSLEGAWDLLDELPREEVDPSFTTATVETIALSADEEFHTVQGRSPRHRSQRFALCGGAVLVAAACGFLAVSLVWPDSNEQLVRDLPLLEDLDAYRHVESIDFLRELQHSGLFDSVPDPKNGA